MKTETISSSIYVGPFIRVSPPISIEEIYTEELEGESGLGLADTKESILQDMTDKVNEQILIPIESIRPQGYGVFIFTDKPDAGFVKFRLETFQDETDGVIREYNREFQRIMRLGREVIVEWGAVEVRCEDGS